MRCRRAAVVGAVLALAAACSSCSSHHTASDRGSSGSASQPTTSAPTRSGREKTATPVSRPDGHGRTYMVPETIATDCSTDDTTALQAWLDQLPDDVTAELRGGGCYRIEGTLDLSDRHRFVLMGNGATLKATTAGTGGRLAQRSRSQLNILDSDDVIVRDLVVRGANPHAGTAPDAYQVALEAQHAFSLHGDDGVTLDDVQAYDVYGDFVYIGGTGSTPSRHITVTHSRFARSGRQGISITDGQDVLITDNDIDDVRRSVFDLEPNKRADEARGIRIEGNRTGAADNYWLADKGSGINVGDVTVSRNVMEKPTGALVIVSGPSFGKRGPFTFVDNRFQTTGTTNDENAHGAFLFANASGVRLSGNVVRVAPAARLAGVDLRGTSGAAILANRFTGVTQTVVHSAPKAAKTPARRRHASG